MNAPCRSVLLVLFLLPFTVPCHGEKIGYDGPYLGTATPSFHKQPYEVATATKDADLIFIGTAKKLDESAYVRPGQGQYMGEIAPEKILKGATTNPVLKLKWDPSATGLEPNSRHIFFVKRKKGRSEALKEIYIHEEGFPCCRTYGAMDGGTEVTLDAITYLISPEAGIPKGHNERLLKELKEERVHRQATAVLLAYETSNVECLPALLYAVENRKEHYPTAIFASCTIDGERGAKSALRLLDVPPARLHSDKLMIFDAIATAGNPASIGPLKELGDQRLEHRVSCAFAIQRIAPDRVAPIVKAWLAEQKHVGKTETIRPGKWEGEVTYSVLTLLKAAIKGEDPLKTAQPEDAKP